MAGDAGNLGGVGGVSTGEQEAAWFASGRSLGEGLTEEEKEQLVQSALK